MQVTTEKRFFAALKRAAPATLTLTRIETAVTATGVADVDYVVRLDKRGAWGWIELKAAALKRNGDIRLRHRFSAQQYQWLLQHDAADDDTPVRSYLMIGVYARTSLDGVVLVPARPSKAFIDRLLIHDDEYLEYYLGVGRCIDALFPGSFYW